jgi:hypothetical protein
MALALFSFGGAKAPLPFLNSLAFPRMEWEREKKISRLTPTKNKVTIVGTSHTEHHDYRS